MAGEVIDFLEAGIRLRGVDAMLAMNTRRLTRGLEPLTWWTDLTANETAFSPTDGMAEPRF